MESDGTFVGTRGPIGDFRALVASGSEGGGATCLEAGFTSLEAYEAGTVERFIVR